MFVNRKDEDVPWVEKYRPDSVTSKYFLNQEQIIKTLRFYVENPDANVPHLIFSGAPGTGKTTAAFALARDLLGKHPPPGSILELNASDERGIETIREKVKEFASTKDFLDIPFKIVILDEADSITREAQAALRRIMEKASGKCRFIMMCNYADKIIDPITSRCAVMRFKPLHPDHVKAHLKVIAKDQGLSVSEPSLDALVFVSMGDLRRAINALQMAASVVEEGKVFEPGLVYELEGFVLPSKVDEVLDLLATPGKDKNALVQLLQAFMQFKGVSTRNLLLQLESALCQRVKDEKKLAMALDAVARTDIRVTLKATNDIQLASLATSLWRALEA